MFKQYENEDSLKQRIVIVVGKSNGIIMNKFTIKLIEHILSEEKLEIIIKKVKSNKGASRITKITVCKLDE